MEGSTLAEPLPGCQRHSSVADSGSRSVYLYLTSLSAPLTLTFSLWLVTALVGDDGHLHPQHVAQAAGRLLTCTHTAGAHQICSWGCPQGPPHAGSMQSSPSAQLLSLCQSVMRNISLCGVAMEHGSATEQGPEGVPLRNAGSSCPLLSRALSLGTALPWGDGEPSSALLGRAGPGNAPCLGEAVSPDSQTGRRSGGCSGCCPRSTGSPLTSPLTCPGG